MKMKVFAVVSLPPPYNGQNIGSLIVKDLLCSSADCSVFRSNLRYYLTDNASFFSKLGYFFLAFNRYLFVVLKVWISFILNRPNRLYYVPSSNLRSVIRDFLFYLPFLLTGKKIICHVRSGDFSIKKKMFRWLYLFDNFHFIFLTPNLANVSGIQSNRYIIIPNFVDEIFDNCARINEVDSSNVLRLVFLSNLFVSKGVFDLISAVKKFKPSAPLHLDIYGKGENEVVNRIKNIISDCPNIIFHGEVSDRNLVKNILAESHIFVLPTTYHIEASPRSIIEAISQKCVPLVTNHAGIPDMIDSSCAFIIDKDKKLSEQIYWVLSNILENRDQLDIIRENSYNRYLEKFSIHILKSKFIEYFFKLN
ncbi:glycosyltransferase family 4 protein [Algoriphagus sp. PAP.12]|uniref:glycosyltransferase family 4 protein n=1 Tax=Algoriphagus sp. PAP.12 TaxID=2996678 RepID=UPI00227CF4B7|nr:glycosyltransferase family 4 protein [Algoriphagus sp. PAP.12]